MQIVAIRLDGIVPTAAPAPVAAPKGRGDPIPAATVESRFDSGALPTPVYERASFGSGHLVRGPAIVVQDDCTTVVSPGWQALTNETGALVMTRRT